MTLLKRAMPLLTLTSALTLGASVAQAATFTVNSTADTNGTSCGTDCTLRQAINVANNTPGDDEIVFDAATFATKKIIAIGTSLGINSSSKLSISAPPVGLIVTRSTQQPFDLISVFGTGRVQLRGLTISRGRNGIYIAGVADISDSTFIGNFRTIFLAGGGETSVSNSTFTGSTDYAFFINAGSKVTLNSTTISGNVNSITNGSGATNLNISNSLIVGNNTNLASGLYTDGGNNIVNVTAADAKLGPLAENGGPSPTFALLPGSPAIDAGATDLATDQRGLPRPAFAADDIGAFELQNAVPVVNPTINSPTRPGPDDLVITDPQGSDADGDPLTYTFVYAINGQVIAGESDKPNRVDLSKYVVNSGDTFTATFTANDGFVDSIPVTLTRTIAPPPVANAASGSAQAGVRSAIGPISGTDPNGLELRYVLLTQPTSGNAFLAGSANNVQLYYTSARTFSGTDSVTFQVVNSDGRRSDPATISISVAGNNIPTADSGGATVKAGVQTEVPLTANDADGDALRYRITTKPANGRAFLSNNTSGGVSLFYTANRNYSGPDSVNFSVTDPSGASATGTISLTVVGNSAPTANAASLSATTGVRASVLLSGSDADGDALVRYRITSQPSNGSAFLAGSGDKVRLYYTSKAGYTGADSAQITVTDSGGRTSAPATVSIQVGSPNPAPIMAPITAPAPSASVS